MASSVRILSGFDKETNIKTFNYYKNFNKYYGKLNKIKILINYLINKTRSSITTNC
jgi:hypothetical protein